MKAEKYAGIPTDELVSMAEREAAAIAGQYGHKPAMDHLDGAKMRLFYRDCEKCPEVAEFWDSAARYWAAWSLFCSTDIDNVVRRSVP